QVVHAAALPSLVRRHVNRAAVPGDLDVAPHGGEDDFLGEPGDRPGGAPARRHLVDHLVELHDGVPVQVGRHGTGLRDGAEDGGGSGTGWSAGRIALARARAPAQQGAQEQPSDLSLSASACRWSRHARSLSRSLATTSAGARAMKFLLVSLASSAASCCSSRVSAPERRRHSCRTSTASASATNTSLPSPSTACAPAPRTPPSSCSSESCASRTIVSRSPSNAARIDSLLGLMAAARRALGGTRYSARMARILSTTCCTRRNCRSSSASTRSGRKLGQFALASKSSGFRPGSFCHSSSVMNGTTGWSRRSAVSKQWASTACAATDVASEAAPAGGPPGSAAVAPPDAASAARRGLTASTYQSASSPHTNS